MTEESKRKLHELVAGTKAVVEIYVWNDIDDYNTRPRILFVHAESDKCTYGNDIEFCTDYMIENFDMYVAVPSIGIREVIEKDGVADIPDGYVKVYSRGEWFV